MSPIVERGSHADLIRREFRESLRRPSFWAAMAREAVPVIGVFFLGWEPIFAGFFFVAESWLFMSTRVAAEMAYDPRSSYSVQEGSASKKLIRFLGMVAGAGLAYGFLVGIIGFFALVLIFPEDQRVVVFAEALTSPTFLAGLAALLLSEGYATYRFVQEIPQWGEDDRESTRLKVRAMFYRCYALLVLSIIFGFLVKLTSGGKAFVLLIFLVMAYFEGCPRDARRVIGRAR